MRRVLYISYDGLTDPLGRSQVTPYLVGLARRGYTITVLSFEKPSASKEDRNRVKAILEAAGTRWVPLPYHKRPTVPATAFDVLQGVVAGLGTRFLGELAFVHARSYVAATMALALKRLLGVPFIFDIRGFWADERFSGTRIYATIKRVERVLFATADHVVSLTHAAKREIERWPSVGGRGVGVTVIPTCVDMASFRPAASVERARPITIGYLGSFAERYLAGQMYGFFGAFRRRVPDARFKIVTSQAPEEIRAGCARAGLPEGAIDVYGVPYDQIPNELAKMDATISLRQPGFASLATCPTKFGESLAAGCPVVVNPGVGDCAEIVSNRNVGVVAEPNPESLDRAAEHLLTLLAEGRPARERCVLTAEKLLSLEGGVDRYASVYDRLGASPIDSEALTTGPGQS